MRDEAEAGQEYYLAVGGAILPTGGVTIYDQVSSSWAASVQLFARGACQLLYRYRLANVGTCAQRLSLLNPVRWGETRDDDRSLPGTDLLHTAIALGAVYPGRHHHVQHRQIYRLLPHVCHSVLSAGHRRHVVAKLSQQVPGNLSLELVVVYHQHLLGPQVDPLLRRCLYGVPAHRQVDREGRSLADLGLQVDGAPVVGDDGLY